jgi:hypothetical protein
VNRQRPNCLLEGAAVSRVDDERFEELLQIDQVWTELGPNGDLTPRSWSWHIVLLPLCQAHTLPPMTGATQI